MDELEWRPLAVADAPAWSMLLDAVRAADGGGEHHGAAELAEELASGLGEEIGVFAGGRLAAVGQILPPATQHDGGIWAHFEGAVHPESRGRGLGTELLAELQRRTLRLCEQRYPGRAVMPRTSAQENALDARELLEEHSYSPVRWFHVMSAAARVGFRSARLRRYRPQGDEAVRSAHTDAFARHWGSGPPAEDRWRLYYTGAGAFRPELSTVAESIDGRVHGYALVYRHENGVAWIGQLGVRPEMRRRGLGKALLQATLAEVAAAGIPIVRLDVDGENADGAGRLYESVGFRTESRHVIYELASASVARRPLAGGSARG